MVAEEPCEGVPKWRLILRGVLFLGIAGYMLFSPASRHFLPKPEYIPYTRGWKYFRDYGKGICDVKYELRRDGQSEPVDRYAVFGVDPEKAPKYLRRIRHGRKISRDVTWVTATMCEKLGPDADSLYVTARCADRDGWYDMYLGEEPICPALRQTRARPRGGPP